MTASTFPSHQSPLSAPHLSLLTDASLRRKMFSGISATGRCCTSGSPACPGTENAPRISSKIQRRTLGMFILKEAINTIHQQNPCICTHKKTHVYLKAIKITKTKLFFDNTQNQFSGQQFSLSNVCINTPTTKTLVTGVNIAHRKLASTASSALKRAKQAGLLRKPSFFSSRW